MVEEGKSTVSAPLILIVEFLVALVLAGGLLHKYGNIRRQNPFVTVSTLVVWFLSFVIIFLLPVDVSSAFYQLCLEQHDYFNASSGDGSVSLGDGSGSLTISCSDFVCADTPSYLDNNPRLCYPCFQPYSFVCPTPLRILWYIIYWLFFILSWIVLPLGQSFVLASYFSVWKKILRALIENAIFYITFLIIFLCLFVYLVVVKKIIALQELPSLLATASNTWGLVILALLLGYGLVEVPRTLWNASRRKYSLTHNYFKAARLYTDMADADDKLKDVTERVKTVSQSLHYNDPLRKYVDVIIAKFPEKVREKFSRGRDDYEDYTQSGEDMLSKSSLESLLKKAVKAVRLSHSTRIHWVALTDQTLDLEDVELNAVSSSRYFKSSVRPHTPSWTDKFLPHLEWYWKVWIRAWVYRVCAVCLGLISFMIVWSEVTFSVHTKNMHFSFFAYLVYAGHDAGNYIAVELLSVVVVAYLSICAYYTVFKIRIFNLYYLAPRHSTDEYSLLFSAVLLSRLALPICLNYLYMIQVVELEVHDEAEVPETAFAYATGNTGLIPWLTNYFYIYYPLLIILVGIATALSLASRLVSILGYQKFIGEDDFSADYIDEGKALMKRERRIRERNLRENGRPLLRTQGPSELLREHRPTHYTRRLAEKAARKPPEGEDDSRWGRFVVKAKGVASKGKAVSAKYVPGRNKKQDDAIELLPTTNSDEPRRSSALNAARREPPKDLFDDI